MAPLHAGRCLLQPGRRAPLQTLITTRGPARGLATPSLSRAQRSQEPCGLHLVARPGFVLECQRVPQGRAVKDFVGSLVVAGNPGADGQVSPALDEQSCHPQPFVVTLCDGVEDGRLPPNTLLVYRGAGIDVGAPIEEQRCRLEVAVLSCDMEQGAPTQRETAAACCPEID